VLLSLCRCTVLKRFCVWGNSMPAITRVKKKNAWIAACPLDKQFSYFACPRRVLVYIFLYNWLADTLPGPLSNGQVIMKSFLSRRKIYLSRPNGWHFLWALNNSSHFLKSFLNFVLSLFSFLGTFFCYKRFSRHVHVEDWKVILSPGFGLSMFWFVDKFSLTLPNLFMKERT